LFLRWLVIKHDQRRPRRVNVNKRLMAAILCAVVALGLVQPASAGNACGGGCGSYSSGGTHIPLLVSHEEARRAHETAQASGAIDAVLLTAKTLLPFDATQNSIPMAWHALGRQSGQIEKDWELVRTQFTGKDTDVVLNVYYQSRTKKAVGLLIDSGQLCQRRFVIDPLSPVRIDPPL